MTGHAFPTAIKAWVLTEQELRECKGLGNGMCGTSSLGAVRGSQGQVVIKALHGFKNKKDRDSYVCAVACIAEGGCSAFARLIGFCPISNTRIALVTELAVKGSLAQAMSKFQETGRWPIGFGYVQRACMHYGIAYFLNMLHQNGKVHGALKPKNVLFAKEYTPLLADFCQASFVSKSIPKLAFKQDPESLLYIAPELLNSLDVTEEGDVYAFGMLIFRSYFPELPLIMNNGVQLDFSSPDEIGVLIADGVRPKKPDAKVTDNGECPEKSQLIGKKNVPKTPEEFPDSIWDLICRCWHQNPMERPKFEDILKELQSIYIFPKNKRRLVEYQKYTETLSGQNDERERLQENKYRLLFAEPIYTRAISALSARVVSDCSYVSERHRKATELLLQCKYCDASYKLAWNYETEMWEAFQKGEHVGHDDKSFARPLKQFLKSCVNSGLAMGVERRRLTDFVSAQTKTPVSRSTVNYYSRSENGLNSLNAWKKIPSLVESFQQAGLRAEVFRTKNDDGEDVLNAVAFELPGASICKTEAFIGLVFVDGCYLSDRVRGTLLAMATITADHVLIPLFGMICTGERKDHYMKFLQFARESLPTKFTIMSDQGTGMAAAYDELFSSCEDVTQLPCMFHIWQSMSKRVRYDMKQVIMCDHPDVYQAMLHVFQRDHKLAFEKYKNVLAKMSFMSDSFAGIFEVKADSPIESLNAAILPYRSQGPFSLMQGLLHFAQGQLQYQENCLRNGSEMYCQSCMNTVEYRKELGATLEPRREPGHYVVPEPFAIGLMVNYNVQVLDVLRCSCEGYERMGIPCRHIYAVTQHFPQEVENLPKITAIHQTKVIKEAIKGAMRKVSFLDIEEEDVKPPPPRRNPGRPPTRRRRPIREYMTSRRKCTCGACGGKGHTRRSNDCPLRQQANAKDERQNQGRDTFKDNAARIMIETRARSVEPQRPPMTTTWSTSCEQGKEIFEVEETIEEEKDKAISALQNGAVDLFTTFA